MSVLCVALALGGCLLSEPLQIQVRNHMEEAISFTISVDGGAVVSASAPGDITGGLGSNYGSVAHTVTSWHFTLLVEDHTRSMRHEQNMSLWSGTYLTVRIDENITVEQTNQPLLRD